mmetsp:Transcript_4022/g.7771  ORF Transcript_4022/g.7771 Transcript_4022/m.7771 type:complete len:351 (+) Transcript_4022:977-2029(+)
MAVRGRGKGGKKEGQKELFDAVISNSSPSLFYLSSSHSVTRRFAASPTSPPYLKRAAESRKKKRGGKRRERTEQKEKRRAEAEMVDRRVSMDWKYKEDVIRCQYSSTYVVDYPPLASDANTKLAQSTDVTGFEKNNRRYLGNRTVPLGDIESEYIERYKRYKAGRPLRPATSVEGSGYTAPLNLPSYPPRDDLRSTTHDAFGKPRYPSDTPSIIARAKGQTGYAPNNAFEWPSKDAKPDPSEYKSKYVPKKGAKPVYAFPDPQESVFTKPLITTGGGYDPDLMRSTYTMNNTVPLRSTSADLYPTGGPTKGSGFYACNPSKVHLGSDGPTNITEYADKYDDDSVVYKKGK